jgi:shikimate dehydrogenase
MQKFGLIGFPLSHSFSKKYFTEKFLRESILNVSYELFPIENIDILPDLLRSEPLLRGLNVTIPYKQQVMPFLDELSPVVKEINACNCIKIEKGKLIGYNTDVIGFEISLKKKLKPHHKKALILGTGGAAKAVEFVLRKNGIDYLQVSRNKSDDAISYTELDNEILSNHHLIINTTPLGMFPEIDKAPPISYTVIGASHYLFDLVYNPSETLFLKHGRLLGADTENGADMLIDQAEASWDIWNAKSSDRI